ncbi:hypothetical protein BIFDEN_01027 [Bifidobacterium dentium ATCC 27678]|nr:hypothetical protein BIFDEN_01027 [Bifidobacterium dentium ATCC 27678]
MMKSQRKIEHTETQQATRTAAGGNKTKDNGTAAKEGNIMKNNTFDQIISANLASIDPGFGQFALAKASSDLFKKVLNK